MRLGRVLVLNGKEDIEDDQISLERKCSFPMSSEVCSLLL
jgi:hypothetical protein